MGVWIRSRVSDCAISASRDQRRRAAVAAAVAAVEVEELYWVMKVVQCGSLLLILIVSEVALWAAACFNLTHTEDRFFMWQSILFAVQFTASVDFSLDVLLTEAASASAGTLRWTSLASAGTALAAALLIAQILLSWRFMRSIRGYRRGAAGAERRRSVASVVEGSSSRGSRGSRGSRLSSPRISLPPALKRRASSSSDSVGSEPSLKAVKSWRFTPSRLRYRNHFLVYRFGRKRPTWQLVIWTRQLLLIISTAVANAVYHADEALAYRLRWVFVGLTLVIMIIAWALHLWRRPYAFGYQNAMESWLYASNILLIALAAAYSEAGSHLDPEGFSVNVHIDLGAGGDDVDVSLVEIILLASLGLTLLLAFAYFVYDLCRTREADLGAFVGSMDRWIDQPMEPLLREGVIRLVRCAWLLDNPDVTITGIRRQDLPEAAFVSGVEAAALFASGQRKVLVLSYPWHSGRAADPTAITANAVRRYLATQTDARDLALFCDFASLPQHGHNMPRTAAETAIFMRGLGAMVSLYASLAGSCVIQQMRIDSRPSSFDGWLVLYFKKPSQQSDEVAAFMRFKEQTTLESVRRRFRRFGEVVEVVSVAEQVDVKMATHAQAVAVLEALSGGRARGLSRARPPEAAPIRSTLRESIGRALSFQQQFDYTVAMKWNARPYGERGWCLCEQGVCQIVLAHMRQAQRRGTLPERYNIERPKLIDISGGMSTVPEAEEDPKVLSDRLQSDIESAAKTKFTGESDRQVVLLQLLDLEWFVMQAIADAKIGARDVGRGRTRSTSLPPAVQATSTALVEVNFDEPIMSAAARRRSVADATRRSSATTAPKYNPGRRSSAPRPAGSAPGAARREGIEGHLSRRISVDNATPRLTSPISRRLSAEDLSPRLAASRRLSADI